MCYWHIISLIKLYCFLITIIDWYEVRMWIIKS